MFEDKTFKNDLEVGDLIHMDNGNYYIVSETDYSEDFPYALYNIRTFRVEKRFSTLTKQVTDRGHILNVGWVRKIVNSGDYTLHAINNRENKERSEG